MRWTARSDSETQRAVNAGCEPDMAFPVSAEIARSSAGNRVGPSMTAGMRVRANHSTARHGTYEADLTTAVPGGSLSP